MEDNVQVVEDTSLLSDTTKEETSTEEANPWNDFVGTLDDDIKENKAWGKFSSTQQLARSYTELEKLIGTRGDIPKEDASDDDWNAFYGKTGRPETANEYGINIKDGLGDGQGRLDEALQIAHDVGISKKQASVFFDKVMDLELGDVNTMADVRAETQRVEMTKLTEAWGNSTDAMVESVTNLEKSLGVFEVFEQKGLNNDADLLIMMSNLAGRLGDDPEISTNTSNTPAGLDNSISEVDSEIKEFLKRGDKVPSHLTNKRRDLFDRKYQD